MLKVPADRDTISGQRSQSRNAFAEVSGGGAGIAGGFTTATFSSVGPGGFGGSRGAGAGAAVDGGGAAAVLGSLGGGGGATFFACAGGAGGGFADGRGADGAVANFAAAAGPAGAAAAGGAEGGPAGGTVSTIVTARSPRQRRPSESFARSTKNPLGYFWRYARMASQSLLARAEFQNAISSVRSSIACGLRTASAGAPFAAGAAASTAAGVKKNGRDISLICWGRCVPRGASFTSDATSLSITESSVPGWVTRLSSAAVNGLLRPLPSLASCPGAAAKATSVSRPLGSMRASPRPTALLRRITSKLRFRLSASGLLRHASTTMMFSGTFDSINRTMASS